MIRYGELDQAITVYTRTVVHGKIPIYYYRQVIKLAITMNNAGKQWDMQQSAMILLSLAFNDGHLQPSQLTPSGLKALDHAERLMESNVLHIDQVGSTSKISLELIG